jgi:hypothetical protein
MKDSPVLTSHAESNANAGGVKTEFTFLWAEADEWKPAMEGPETMEETNFPIFLT